jgi:tetratricopeptide (TPR) repeat protein
MLIAAAAVWVSAARAADIWPDILDAYARGDYVSARTRLQAYAGDKHALDDLDKASSRWIEQGGQAHSWRRTLVASALALELVHARRAADRGLSTIDAGAALSLERTLTRENEDRIQLVLRAADRVAAARPSTPGAAELAWYLASMATLEELDQTWAVLGGPPAGGQPVMDGKLDSLQHSQGASGYLGRALARFPGEPRLQLARIEAEEAAAHCPRNFCYEVATPAAVADLRRRANQGAEAAPPSFSRGVATAGEHFAQVNLRIFQTLPVIMARYASLARDPVVGAETELHIGGLAVRLAEWNVALEHLARVSAGAHEPFLLGLAQYLSGRALEGAGRPDEAIAAYDRALALLPHSRSTATLLSAALVLRGRPADHSQAADVLGAAYAGNGRVDDPWMLFGRGDARLWSALTARLQESLQ